MKNIIHKKPDEILLTLKRIESSLWLLNGDERLKDLTRRLDIQNGNNEELWKRLEAFEKYFGVEFIKEQNYRKKRNCLK